MHRPRRAAWKFSWQVLFRGGLQLSWKNLWIKNIEQHVLGLFANLQTRMDLPICGSWQAYMLCGRRLLHGQKVRVLNLLLYWLVARRRILLLLVLRPLHELLEFHFAVNCHSYLSVQSLLLIIYNKLRSIQSLQPHSLVFWGGSPCGTTAGILLECSHSWSHFLRPFVEVSSVSRVPYVIMSHVTCFCHFMPRKQQPVKKTPIKLRNDGLTLE